MDFAAYQPATPPRSSQPPPPRSGGGFPRFQRSRAADITATPASPPPPLPSSQAPPESPQRHLNPSSGPEGLAAASRTPDRKRSHGDQQRHQNAPAEEGTHYASVQSNNTNAMIPAGLTEAAVQRALGNGCALASSPSPATAGGAVAGGSGRAGGIIMPTRKEGSDSASMYSMARSVLPMDPRERIYYRPLRRLLQCYLERRKRKGLGIASLLPGRHQSFQFFLEHTGDFVLAAVLRSFKTRTMVEDTSSGVGGQLYPVSRGGASIVFTINQQQLDSDTRGFVGKLSRRGKGMEMVLFSEGSKAARKEILAVLLHNLADTNRSSFTVLLPAIDPESGYIKPLEGGEVEFLRDGRGSSHVGIDEAMANSSDDDVDAAYSTMSRATPNFTAVCDSAGANRAPAPSSSETAGRQKKWFSRGVLVREYRRNPGSPNIIVLKSKEPQWDGVLRGYKLDFHGRSTKASEKNFQLVAVSDPGKVVMLFGKQDDNRFALDFRYPLCGLQAAAIATTIMTARKAIL
ncbi:tub family protein-like protein [Leishmania donovani]|nr:tub family protein-like protein [Leishmania donovani]CBZ32780.1 tub family protein-like protein [Leishmania donovani]